MAKKKEKKKMSPVFMGVVIVIMLAAFVVQKLFPVSLGDTWSKLTENADEITVTAVAKGDYEGGGITYFTDRTEDIFAFGSWAQGVSMKSESLANRLSADKPLEYLFSIHTLSGSYIDLIIDEKGYVQTGAEVYRITGNVEEFLAELDLQLQSWSGQ